MEGPAVFFATATRGTEEVLADELRELGLEQVEARRGGVAFGTHLAHAYRACLWSRVASRVLMPLASFEATTAEALYAGVRAIPWTDHLGPERSLAVAVAGSRSPVGPSHFLALKTKDAIVDRIREVEGSRPDVDKRDPDVRVHVHTSGATVTVSLDLAVRGLHRRGHERTGAAAPLRENLAAAMLRLAGWSDRGGEVPLWDPMCGTGTLLLEAAAMALDTAPGLRRGRTGAEGWRGHDAVLWSALLEEARDRRAAAAGRVPRIAGSDASPGALDLARRTIARAGLRRVIRVERRELAEASPPWTGPGLVVTNPPYGVRLGEAGELGPLYELLGDTLRRRLPGWTAWVLVGNPALEKRIGLRAVSRRVLHNGPITCRYLEYPLSSTPPSRADGPAWRRPAPEARGFRRRLRANLRRRQAWADREGIDCYRLYDADVPTYNVAVDRYGPRVRIEEYARPPSVPEAEADRRLRDAIQIVTELLDVERSDVVLRVRRRLSAGEQHERYGDRGRYDEVREGDLRFRVNLDDYLDTGLFLDDRPLRGWVRRHAAGVDFLNLFAYTCTASVAAAAGGARSTTSVDLSRRYLDWGRENFELNGIGGANHRFVRDEAWRFVSRGRPAHHGYGLAFVAPPTRSRSKAMRAEFNLQRDHAKLLAATLRLLSPRGTILFATSARRFELDATALSGTTIRELTAELAAPDFASRPRLRVWELRPARAR